MTLLGSVLEVARREWQWIPTNPMRDVKRPANPDHRERIISGLEVRQMLRALPCGLPPLLLVCKGLEAGTLRLPLTPLGESSQAVVEAAMREVGVL